MVLARSATTTPSPGHAKQGTTWPGTPGAVAGSDCGGDTGIFCPPDQGPRVVSFATEVPNGTGQTLTWENLKAGTYLIESGTHPSIQGPMGLYGMLVVTDTTTSPATAYTGVTYNADVPLLLSEIDPVQNDGVVAAVGTAGFDENAVIVMRNAVSDVTIADGGSGYVVGDLLTLTGGGGTGAVAAVTEVDHGVAGIGDITAISLDPSDGGSPGSGYTSRSHGLHGRQRLGRRTRSCGDTGGRKLQRRRRGLLSPGGQLRSALLHGQRRVL